MSYFVFNQFARLCSLLPGSKHEEEPLPRFSESTLAGSREGLLFIDAKGRVAGADPGIATLLHYGPEELHGKRYTRLFTPAQVQSQAPELAFFLANKEGRHVGPVWRQQKGGDVVPLQSRLEALRNGEGSVCGYLEGLEAAPKGTEPAATTSDGEAVLILERQHKDRFPKIALAGCDVSWITGWPLAEVVGKEWDFLFSSLDGETRATLVGAVLGGLPGQGRGRIRRKDGGIVAVFCRILPLDSGTKQAARAIMKFSLLPSHELDGAENSPAVSDEGRLANEFNNLLTVIMGQSTLSELDENGEGTPRLKRIESSILKAASLARHLLELRRVQADGALDVRSRKEGEDDRKAEEGVPFFQEWLQGNEAAPTAPAEKPSEAQAADWPTGTETILLVDDNTTIRRLLSASLRTLGYRVIEVGDQEMALAVIQSDAPIDLLVADVVLPSGGGEEIAARFREHRGSARVLYISGYLQNNAHVGEVVRDEAFLPKPFTPLGLARKIREVLGPAS